MARTITAELRAVLEEDRLLCAEIPAVTEGYRAWVSVGANFDGDAIYGYNTTHFEYHIEWLEQEYDPHIEELPVWDTRFFATEAQLNAYLLVVLPESAALIRVANDPDYPR